MNSQQKSASVHRHFHYHYHYDIKDRQTNLIEKYSSTSSRSPKHSQMTNQKLSWKNNLNPEVTRLYDQMSDSESLQGISTARASSYNQQKGRQKISVIPFQRRQTNNLTQSRIYLIQNIEEYEEYLKKRSGSNLYIPNTVSFIKLGYRDIQNPEQNTSLKDIRKVKSASKISLQDILRKKADKNIIFNEKNYKSTTARQQNKGIKDLQVNFSKNKNSFLNNLVHRSEIKHSKKDDFTDKDKNALSHILSNSQNGNFDEQNKAFPLFQRGLKQDNLNKSDQKMYQTLEQSVKQQQQNNKVDKNINKMNKTDDKSDNYEYEIVKEECEYLRNKFIEHIQMIHNIKL